MRLQPNQQQIGPLTGDPVVTVQELAAFLDLPSVDGVAEALLSAAVQVADNYTRRAVGVREATYWYDLPLPRPGVSSPWVPSEMAGLVVPSPPLRSVTEVAVQTGAGTWTAVDFTPPVSATDTLIATAATWPAPAVYRAAYRVTVEAGYDAATLPDDLRSAVLLLSAYTYDHRGCTMQAAMQNSGAGTIFGAYRLNRVA